MHPTSALGGNRTSSLHRFHNSELSGSFSTSVHPLWDHLVNFDLELEGRRALVTGGTKGVGAAVVDVLSEQGAKVITTARSVPSVSRDGVAYIAADITTAEGCSAVVRAAFEQLGGIDILVNVLGGSKAP